MSTYVTDHGNMALAVADAGCGIEKKDRDKIFLPFYTTKSGGTGLGLPIVKKIVEAHGGDLHVYPNKGRGVTFRALLPAIQAVDIIGKYEKEGKRSPSRQFKEGRRTINPMMA